MSTNDNIILALRLLADLSAEVVERCPVAACPVCAPLLDAAA